MEFREVKPGEIFGLLEPNGAGKTTWSTLGSFPILQKIVLVNPLVYASEGLRGTLAPSIPHMSPPVVVIVLVVADALLVLFGLNRFYRRAIT